MYTSTQPLWEEKNTFPFNECILSFNGTRPKGKWTFWISFYKDEWLKYFEWGSLGQRSFQSETKHSFSTQDIAVPKSISTQFSIRVEGNELEKLKKLHVCLTHLEKYQLVKPKNLPPVLIQNVPQISQMRLNHPRRKDLCSPTSTTIASNFLMKNRKIDPVTFASECHDHGFDIYGNWIFSVAASFSNTLLPCHVERLNSFHHLHIHLQRKSPVIVSVKGQLKGAPKLYDQGHLMCVVGYANEMVYCIDPAFEEVEKTFVQYPLEDFLEGWKERKNLSYVFST